MKRLLHLTATILLLSVTAALPAMAGDVLDGVIATVNHQPLLRSDWDEAVRFEAFMQQKQLAQISKSDRLQALQRLIDRQLLKAQMSEAAATQPSTDAVEQDVIKLRE